MGREEEVQKNQKGKKRMDGWDGFGCKIVQQRMERKRREAMVRRAGSTVRVITTKLGIDRRGKMTVALRVFWQEEPAEKSILCS